MAKITNAGLALIAQLQANEDTLIIDKMIYANIDGVDYNQEPPGTEAMPDAGDIVRESDIADAGYIDPNTVVYSDVLDSEIGDFSFNWIGLYCSEFDTLVAVTYVPLQTKRATSGFNTGNTICKNFALNYTDIQDLTGIVIEAAAWQQDLSGLYAPLDHNHDDEYAAIDHTHDYIERGMILSNNAVDPDYDIDISPGLILSSDYSVWGTLAAALTKQIDATWADGNNTGGRAAGVALAASTWYHKHALIKPDGTVNAGFDTSITAAGLLVDAAVIAAGYTKYKYLGSALTDSTGKIIPGEWRDMGGSIIFRFKTPTCDYNAVSSTSYVTSIVSTPPDVNANALLVAGSSGDTTPDRQNFWIGNPNETAPASYPFWVNETGSCYVEAPTNTASQIKHIQYYNQANFIIFTLGYQYAR